MAWGSPHCPLPQNGFLIATKNTVFDSIYALLWKLHIHRYEK